MRARIVGAVVGIVLAISIAIWWSRDAGEHGDQRALDVTSFRRLRDATLARARILAIDRKARRRAGAQGSANGSIGQEFIEHRCVLGTAALCRALADVISDCDAGDAATCKAVGQYLADTPPRRAIGIGFFEKACDLGDPEACAYYRLLRDERAVMTAADCQRDPFACTFRAMQTADPTLFAIACEHESGDACLWMRLLAEREETTGNHDRSKRYLERACELGMPMACAALADRLSAGCRPVADAEPSICYPPDETEAKQAREIGCEAGWGEGCPGGNGPR